MLQAWESTGHGDVSRLGTAGAAASGDAMLVGSSGTALECLMREALDVPGAAAALLEAFAIQSRTLRLVQEADARGAATLPPDLRQRLAAAAAITPSWLTLGAGLRA